MTAPSAHLANVAPAQVLHYRGDLTAEPDLIGTRLGPKPPRRAPVDHRRHVRPSGRPDHRVPLLHRA